MDKKRCFLIGHHDAPESIYPALQREIERHITELGVTEFIVGHYGNFDRMAARALVEAKQAHPEISLWLLLPYHPAEQKVEVPEGFDGSFYPEGMESVPRRVAIVKAKGAVAMSKYDTPNYDDCRRWIQRRRERGAAWDHLQLACKDTEEQLISFLKSRQEEDDWPTFSVAEWKELVSELEEYEDKQKNLDFQGNDGALFDVKQDNGLTVPENEKSSWQLYKKSLGWNPESIQDLEKATIGILRRLSNDTREIGPIKGLVIGHVQSGKTANMEALMAMAADHGWNMFIVLSGTIENLRLQTLKRMQKDLNQEGNLIWRGVEHPSKRSQYGERAQDLHFDPNAQSRYFTVCLKNASRLKKLIDWIHADKAPHDLMKILIIDDEADQASISNTAVEYKQAQKERKGINKLIVHLVEDTHYKEGHTNGHAQAMNYVMYTATPYANFLNESTEDSLYPRNFIWTLKTSNEYIGPNQIFGFNDPSKPDGLDIKRMISNEDLDRIAQIYEGKSFELPETLKDAICWFACAVASMRNWGYKKPISMLVHTSQKQLNHDAVAKAIRSRRSRRLSGRLSAAAIGKIKAAVDFPDGKFAAVFYI